LLVRLHRRENDAFCYRNYKKELEQALENEVVQIIVANSDLAKNIRLVKTASNIAISVAIAAVGIGATNFWNPVGWGAGLVGAAASGTTIALGLGVTLIWAIHNNYEIKAGGNVKLPDGTVMEGELILQKKGSYAYSPKICT
jgi:hypothetical protein